jgi:hypothetical protein
MTPIELYQTEVARRSKEVVPADEQSSFLSQEVSMPLIVPGNHDNPEAARTTSFQERTWSREAAELFGTMLDAVSTASSVSTASPPPLTEFLFGLLGPKARVDSMLGDLEEHFHADCESIGDSRARWRYRRRVWRSLGPLIFHKLKNWGFLAFVLELGRRKIGW